MGSKPDQGKKGIIQDQLVLIDNNDKNTKRVEAMFQKGQSGGGGRDQKGIYKHMEKALGSAN